MDLALAGKIAVVTGASKGIGLAITRALVEEGARVVAGARSIESLAGLAGVTAVAVDLAGVVMLRSHGHLCCRSGQQCRAEGR